MKKEPRNLTIPKKFLIAAMILAAVLLAQFVLFPVLGIGQNRDMHFVGTGRGFSYDFDSGAAFHSNDSRYFFYVTRESVRRIRASNENLEWHHSFALNSPWISARGDFVAVGEQRGGRVIYVLNDSGFLYRVSLENTIQAFWINETGFLSVIVQYERGGHGVYVFNQARHTEESPFFRQTIFYDLVFPTRAEVSPDGRYIAIVMVDATVTIRTSVQFRYTSQWDAWGTDQGHFATQDFPMEYVTALRFMSGNRLVIATTAQIVCFQLGPGHQISNRLWDIQLENEKTAIEFYDGSHFAFATGSRLFTAVGEGYPMGTVHIYNMNRQRTGTFEMGRRVSHMRMGHNAIIVGGDRSFHAINFRGNSIWEYTSLFDTRDVLFLDDTNTILVAGSNQAEIFERRRRREEEPSEVDLW